MAKEKEAHKRTWERGPRERTLRSRVWDRTGFGGKTVWDWLQLLIVPLMLALITVVFTWQQEARQLRIENQRAEAERELAEQRAQDEALQAYLDQMNNLLLEHDLRNSEEDSEMRTLARARTLTVLRRLDSSDKGVVMLFLEEAELIQTGPEEEGPPIISLRGAPLQDVNLSTSDLRRADLSLADLRNANLSLTTLIGADLSGADLSGADLSNAGLIDADLSYAILSGADLSNAVLGFVNLKEADLSGADLSETDLTYANLTEAEGITNEELDQQASSLEDATMPNGQKYEEWLKDREGRGEDGKNSGPS